MPQKTTEISASDYQKILSQVQREISQTEKKIFNNVTRQKVEMAWMIGKIIDLALHKKDEKTYGLQLVIKLEEDVKISRKVLYKMRSFYKAYPRLPKDDPQLNWSHYRVLSGVKKVDERKYLEDLTRKNSWDSDQLEKEVSAHKEAAPKVVLKVKSGKIQPTRGKVFTYKIVAIDESKKLFFDCGFKIYREVKESLPKGAEVVFVSKKKIPLSREIESTRSETKRDDGGAYSEKYSLKKSDTAPQQLHCFKATLKRVVDGDTLRVNLDLGFGIFHEEIIRLAKINCVEVAQEDGKKSKVELEKILGAVPFFVLKSIKTDIFNRYVADIFLPLSGKETGGKEVGGKEIDLQKVADEGVYLNQLLLDEGVAVVF